ncbi:MAG TPA: hypothetical protein V6C89_00965 [Drouetiella sp.]|jgi:hypothetical protein
MSPLLTSFRNYGAKAVLAALFCLLASASPAPSAKTETQRTMTFPSDRSYGTIINLGQNWNILDKHPKGPTVGEAQGTIHYSANDALMLTARFPLTDHPEVMNKLPVDAFQLITFINLPTEDKIFAPLTHLTGLRRVDFEEGEFQDKAFGQLGKLTNLESIIFRECFVTGESFLHFGSLKKLRILVIKKSALDWKLLKQSSPVFPAMENLQLTDTNFDDVGMEWLQKMPNLTRLYLDTNIRVTDKGLLLLKNLKKLKKLELKKMKGVTARGIMKLRGSSIDSIHVGDGNYTPEQVKQIKDAMPTVQFVFDKKPIKEDTMEIFAPLH